MVQVDCILPQVVWTFNQFVLHSEQQTVQMFKDSWWLEEAISHAPSPQENFVSAVLGVLCFGSACKISGGWRVEVGSCDERVKEKTGVHECFSRNPTGIMLISASTWESFVLSCVVGVGGVCFKILQLLSEERKNEMSLWKRHSSVWKLSKLWSSTCLNLHLRRWHHRRSSRSSSSRGVLRTRFTSLHSAALFV